MIHIPNPPPRGFSKWTHRHKGGEYTFLTAAKGTGPDHGVDFAYYLGTDRGTGVLAAFVRRMDDWHAVMVPLNQPADIPTPKAAALEELDDFDMDDFDLEEL